MDAARGRPDPSVAQNLADKPWTFEFFEAVRLLTLMAEDRQPVGGPAAPDREAVRFRVHRTFSFPAATIQGLKSRETGPPQEMEVNFLGLIGPKGVLPWHYSESAGIGEASALADFFDLFHHRLISLFYRAWEKYRLPIGFERADTRRSLDRFTASLFDVIGLGAASLRNRQPYRDVAMLRYAGLVAQRPHNAVSLRNLLSDYFQVPVEVEQFRGRWFALRPESLSWLDQPGVHNQLGYGAVAGDEVWNQQAGFRLRLGPLSLERLLRFLPGEPANLELNSWTVFWADAHLDFEVQLVLQADQVPYCRLGDDSPTGPRLGLLSWLKTEEFTQHADEVVFRGSSPFDPEPLRSSS